MRVQCVSFFSLIEPFDLPLLGAAQTPYMLCNRSLSCGGNWSEKRFQFSAPTWFLNVSSIWTKRKKKVTTSHISAGSIEWRWFSIRVLGDGADYFIYLFFSIPSETYPSNLPLALSRTPQRRRKRWSLERRRPDWRWSFDTYLWTRNPSLRYLLCFAKKCTYWIINLHRRCY